MKQLIHLTPNIRLSREVWLSPASDPTARGDGTFKSPHSVSDLARWVDRDVVLKLKPGYYEMSPVKLPQNSKIAIICPEGRAKIKLLSPTGTNIENMVYALDENSGIHTLYLYGLDFDCNWSDLYAAAKLAGKQDNFKLGAVSVRAWHAKIEHCTVINFGCDGGAYGNLGSEVFPLRLETYAGGPPYDKYAQGWPQTVKGEAPSGVWIRASGVFKPHFVNGGYCTAIFVRTCQPGQGDRLPRGVRSTLAALVDECTVNVPGGIAYGCAESDSVRFHDNDAHDTKCAFNFDTGSVYGLEISDNSFFGMNQGINCEGASRDINIWGNHIELVSQFYNDKLGKTEPSFSIRVKNATGVTVEDNAILFEDGLPHIAQLPGGIKDENSYEMIVRAISPDPVPEPVFTAPDNAEIRRLSASIAALDTENKRLNDALSLSMNEKNELGLMIHALEREKAALAKAVEMATSDLKSEQTRTLTLNGLISEKNRKIETLEAEVAEVSKFKNIAKLFAMLVRDANNLKLD